MSDTWMTIAEAAAALKVHPRTIERRIASGKIQTRRADDGLLQVQIDLPDSTGDVPGAALETVRELANDQVNLATGSASALVRFAQDDAARARDELSFARRDAGRARHSALAAWGVVALLGLGTTIAVGWTASTITRAHSDVQKLNERAELIEHETQKLIAERDHARQDAEHARLQAVESTAKLAVYKEQLDNRPTTRPAGLLERIASAIVQE